MNERQLDKNAARRLAIIRHAREVTGNVALTCRYYGISRQVFYVWYRRYEAEGPAGLRDRSTRPAHCPHETPPKWWRRSTSKCSSKVQQPTPSRIDFRLAMAPSSGPTSAASSGGELSIFDVGELLWRAAVRENAASVCAFHEAKPPPAGPSQSSGNLHRAAAGTRSGGPR